MIPLAVAYVGVAAFVVTFGIAADDDAHTEYGGGMSDGEAIAMLARAAFWLFVLVAALVVVAVDAAVATRRR